MATTAETSRARTAVLVEGVSDQLALEALARRRGRNLEAEGVSIVPMGGATNIRTFLNRFGPQGLDLKVAGLCDVGEEGDFRRGLERAGLGSSLTRADMERLGFYVCVADLEDELIRALGIATVERVIEAQGELEALRTFQREPQWRARTAEEQLRRSARTGAGRSNPRPYSSRRWTSSECLGRWTQSLPMCDAGRARSRCCGQPLSRSPRRRCSAARRQGS